jgi:IS30 family transposase
VDTKHADLVDQTVIHALEEMPISWVKTITFDNGSEFAGHETMAGVLPASIYFAAPYSSYQRGTNENSNGPIRRYLPKGTPFRGLTDQQIRQTEEDLNNRPRKILGYQTL